jgi:hypothetical protein
MWTTLCSGPLLNDSFGGSWFGGGGARWPNKRERLESGIFFKLALKTQNRVKVSRKITKILLSSLNIFRFDFYINFNYLSY